MATYRFYANMSISEEIEVEADSYDEAFDLALAEANNSYSVLTPAGYSSYFDDIQIDDSPLNVYATFQLEDSYIPEED